MLKSADIGQSTTFDFFTDEKENMEAHQHIMHVSVRVDKEKVKVRGMALKLARGHFPTNPGKNSLVVALITSQDRTFGKISFFLHHFAQQI